MSKFEEVFQPYSTEEIKVMEKKYPEFCFPETCEWGGASNEIWRNEIEEI